MKTKNRVLLAVIAFVAIGVLAGFAVNLHGNVVNADTGYQLGGAAPSSHLLCGNGTNYVDCASAPTASALSATPSQCSGGTPIASGVQANGNANCIANPSGPTRSCNSNGCYIQYSDGTIEAWGNSSPIGSTGTAFTTAITFPVTFTTTTNLQLVVSATTSATGDGNPHPSECHVVRSSLSTSGASSVISISTQVSGSGYADLAVGDYCAWHAFGQ